MYTKALYKIIDRVNELYKTLSFVIAINCHIS